MRRTAEPLSSLKRVTIRLDFPIRRETSMEAASRLFDDARPELGAGYQSLEQHKYDQAIQQADAFLMTNCSGAPNVCMTAATNAKARKAMALTR